MLTEAGALESALIVRAGTGSDDDAYARLVDMHQAKVRTFLLRLCRDAATSDDLAQDTFLIALQKLGQYRGNCRFSTWLCAIAYRCFLQLERRQRREQQVQQAYADRQTMLESYYDAITPEQIAMEKALLQMDQRQAAALTLSYSLECSHGEIARIMQLPLGTVKSHIQRGKENLRALLTATTVEKAS